MTKSKLLSDESYLSIFDKIVNSRTESKFALLDPAKCFSKHGIYIADSASFNKYIYEANPDLKKHFLAGSIGKPDVEGIALCKKPNPKKAFKRIICITRTTMLASAIITAYLDDEDARILLQLSKITKVAEAVMKGIIKDTKDPAKIIGRICSALGD